MPCKKNRQLFLDLSLHKIDLGRVKNMLDHIQECETCRRALAEYDILESELHLDENNEEQIPAGGWEKFEARLLNIHPEVKKSTPIKKGLTISFAAAALIFLGFFISQINLSQQPDATVTVEDAEQASLDFKPLEMKEDVQVFKTLSEYYDNRTKWVLVGDNTSDLGIAPTPLSSSHEVYLLKLVMTHKKKVLSQVKLVIVPGQKAQLAIPINEHKELCYDIETTPEIPTQLAINVRLYTPNGEKKLLAALSTILSLQSKKVFSPGKLITSSGEYEFAVAFSKSNLSK